MEKNVLEKEIARINFKNSELLKWTQETLGANKDSIEENIEFLIN